MTWIKKVPKPHECIPPRRARGYRKWTGSWFECQCGQIWEVGYVRQFDNDYVWRKI